MEFASKTSIGKRQSDTQHSINATNHMPIKISNNNLPLCCIAIATLTNIVINKQKQQFKENLLAAKPFMILLNQIPKNMMVYSNKQSIVRTIQSYLQVICNRKYRNTAQISQSIHDLFKSKPVFLFSMLCFIRSKGIQQLEQHKQQYLYELIGNEVDVLNNYQSQVRGNSLKLICQGMKQKWIFQYNNIDEVFGKEKKENRAKMHQDTWFMETQQSTLTTHNLNLPQSHKLQRSNSTYNSIKYMNDDDYNSMLSREDLPTTRHCRNCGRCKIGRFCHHCRGFNPVGKQNMTYI